ncbi:hypothetical protein D9758_017105 [Tetrapyrgos nigripes]|uniref:F-box domain-containing protein n=1 Tax=Tetrapyrgos nigripes TaxID=182062 RepID=A0A8H5FE82_9AGAR|nr:hypothetical protein D9758_017105 [Tetrapyrgos nigripes]
MTGLIDLPTETLHAIIAEVGLEYQHLTIFRSVCKRLNAITEPSLFSEVTINTHPNTLLMTTIPFCKALCNPEFGGSQRATGPNCLAVHVKKLKITSRPAETYSRSRSPLSDYLQSSSLPGFDRESLLNAWPEQFIQTLASFVNVVSVHWTISEHTLKRMFAEIPETLTKHATLSKFRLEGPYWAPYCPEPICLHHLKNLQTLVINERFPYDGFYASILQPLSTVLKNSPDLEEIELDSPSPTTVRRGPPNEPYSLADLFANVSPTVSLKIRKLKLKGLSLASHMNHEAIIIPHLKSLTYLTVDDGLGMKDDFWRILWKAKADLEELEVKSGVVEGLLKYLGEFHSGLRILHLRGITKGSDSAQLDHLADIFYGSILPRFARKLRKLVIVPSHEGKWCFELHTLDVFSKCTNLQHLEVCLRLGSVYDVMMPLLNLAHALPNLSTLSLRSVGSPLNQQSWRWSRSDNFSTIESVLRDAIPAEEHANSPLQISVGHSMFSIGRGEDGSLKYCNPRQPNLNLLRGYALEMSRNQ